MHGDHVQRSVPVQIGHAHMGEELREPSALGEDRVVRRQEQSVRRVQSRPAAGISEIFVARDLDPSIAQHIGDRRGANPERRRNRRADLGAVAAKYLKPVHPRANDVVLAIAVAVAGGEPVVCSSVEYVRVDGKPRKHDAISRPCEHLMVIGSDHLGRRIARDVGDDRRPLRRGTVALGSHRLRPARPHRSVGLEYHYLVTRPDEDLLYAVVVEVRNREIVLVRYRYELLWPAGANRRIDDDPAALLLVTTPEDVVTVSRKSKRSPSVSPDTSSVPRSPWRTGVV